MTDPIRQAVVLAGGRGTRLGSLTEDTPKPLLAVGGRPFLDWVVDNLARQGVSEVLLTVGYRADAFEPWQAGRTSGPVVSTFVEPEPLGTGGALPLLGTRLQERFFVLNGDTLFDAPLLPLGRLLDDRDVAAAVALRAVEDTGRYGRVRLVERTVTEFSEKSGAGPGLINGGVYALRRSAIEGLGSPSSIERDLLPHLAAHGALRGLPSDGFFIDIGVPETYAEAQERVPAWWRKVSEGKQEGGPRR